MAMSTMSEPQQLETGYVRAPAPIILTDIQVPFGRAFGICMKWGFAAILSGFILGILCAPLWIILGVIFAGS